MFVDVHVQMAARAFHVAEVDGRRQWRQPRSEPRLALVVPTGNGGTADAGQGEADRVDVDAASRACACAPSRGRARYGLGADVAHKLVVGDFLPFDGPLNVRVMEHDRAGKRNRARDHAIVVFDWAPPFDPHVELTNSNGDYTIAVQFDR